MFRTTFPPVELVPATRELLDALQRDRPLFEREFGSPIPAHWPEFPESIAFTADRLGTHPEEAGWWLHFFRDPATGLLIGSGGYTGPPRDGLVEFGYEVAPAFRGRRFGVGAAAALALQAVASGQVSTLMAHTLAAVSPSTRVLSGLGFEKVAEVDDPDEGPVWEWRRDVV